MTINQNYFKAQFEAQGVLLRYRFATLADVEAFTATEDPIYIVPLIIEECETWRN